MNNHNDDSQEYLEGEDSDDSVKDRDYTPNESDGSSSEDVENGFNEEDHIKKKLIEEKESWKGRPKKGRNPKYPGQTFQTRKKMKDSNLTHYTVGGKIRETKQFIDYKCTCIKKCDENVSRDEKEICFKTFWNLASYDLQTGYIGATVKEMPIKRKRTKATGKTYTRRYMIGENEVCRDTYIKTYQISSKRVNTALNKIRVSDVKDNRGKHGRKAPIPEETKTQIIEHIKRFPTYISHYSRSETETKFLPFDLTQKNV
uniref:Uncharacterized protein LOC114331499 n=1 Tax=Diabrotica virgifera virgifera TaxID=50390 RepID=A0A6P7FVC4_DIAVI